MVYRAVYSLYNIRFSKSYYKTYNLELEYWNEVKYPHNIKVFPFQNNFTIWNRNNNEKNKF